MRKDSPKKFVRRTLAASIFVGMTSSGMIFFEDAQAQIWASPGQSSNVPSQPTAPAAKAPTPSPVLGPNDPGCPAVSRPGSYAPCMAELPPGAGPNTPVHLYHYLNSPQAGGVHTSAIPKAQSIAMLPNPQKIWAQWKKVPLLAVTYSARLDGGIGQSNPTSPPPGCPYGYASGPTWTGWDATGWAYTCNPPPPPPPAASSPAASGPLAVGQSYVTPYGAYITNLGNGQYSWVNPSEGINTPIISSGVINSDGSVSITFNNTASGGNTNLTDTIYQPNADGTQNYSVVNYDANGNIVAGAATNNGVLTGTSNSLAALNGSLQAGTANVSQSLNLGSAQTVTGSAAQTVLSNLQQGNAGAALSAIVAPGAAGATTLGSMPPIQGSAAAGVGGAVVTFGV
jgi:hypothetical protein